MEFKILAEAGLPKSFISDFGLEGGKTLYKDIRTIHGYS